MIGLVMAGGKGTRMNLENEKLLLEHKKPIILQVIDSLTNSNCFSKIIALTSPNSPKTKKLLQENNIEIFDTLGTNYVEDLNSILKILNDERVISTRYDADFNPDTPVPRGQVAEMILKKMGFNILGNTFEELFSDVPRHNRYARYIMKAKELGIVEGYPDGTFRPDSSISRSETLAMILRAFEIDILDGGMQFYPDVPRHEWFFKYVDTGTVHALVSGYDTGRFGPHDPITFGEITKILFQVGELNKTN